jgi:lysine-specific demethylase 8
LWKVLRLVEKRHEQQSDDQMSKDREGVGSVEKGDWIDEAVRLLDMSLILTGAPQREELVELWFAALKDVLYVQVAELDTSISERPSKRMKLSHTLQTSRLPLSFPTDLPTPIPTLRYPIPRSKELGLSSFQKIVGDAEKHTPFIIETALQHWPALEERPWNSPRYLLEQTLGGRRLIPVEVGKSYTDEGWGQRIIKFREFMETYMLEGHAGDTSNEGRKATPDSSDGTTKPPGYLAQHDLFTQIPSLRADISIPDYCYCEPSPSPSLTHIKPVAKLDDPLLNAWFGPAGTVSPLHTDPYHNILAQVVGYKYVRLYAPDETERLYPRSVDENGIDMSNTSEVDLDEAMTVWPGISCWTTKAKADEELRRELENQFPEFKNAKYIEGILGPGECLYLPVGWWHYIRSLTPSFSVSFWFN